MDLKQIAKLKVIAFFQRDKIRDLFDFEKFWKQNSSFEDILQISKELKIYLHKAINKIYFR